MTFAMCLSCLVLSGVPALLFLANLRVYRTPAAPWQGEVSPAVSVLIPARNEAATIDASVRSVLDAGQGVELEVIVLDDHSIDATAAVVRAIPDPRLRLESAPQLPPGWCGKQHACHALGELARNPILIFMDADVRLAPGSLARMAGFLQESGADLASGFPREETGGLVEKMVIPLIHFVLLGFLPISRMRRSTRPRFSAGCGQLFAASQSAYQRMGGHAAIRSTLHDGIRLPRAFREAGLKTDLFDATELATCRMYHGWREVWEGLSKNATEALAAPSMIVPATVILFGGQVLPFLLLGLSAALEISTYLTLILAAAVLGAYLPRIVGVFRFRQSPLGAALHPLGVLLLLLIQWHALGRALMGRPSSWRGRFYPTASGCPASIGQEVSGAGVSEQSLALGDSPLLVGATTEASIYDRVIEVGNHI